MLIWTTFVLLAPPIVGYVAYYSYQRKRRKGKKRRSWKSYWKTVPISAATSAWINVVVGYPSIFGISVNNQYTSLFQRLTDLLPFFPGGGEVALFVIIMLVVILLILPGP